jgi:hypothetical protein
VLYTNAEMKVPAAEITTINPNGWLDDNIVGKRDLWDDVAMAAASDSKMAE